MDFERLQSIPADAAMYAQNWAEFAANASFERPSLAYASAVALAGLGAAVAERYRQMKRAEGELVYPDPNDSPDKNETVRSALKWQRTKNVVAGGVAALAVTSGLAHEAKPSTEIIQSRIDSAAVIIDTGSGTYARDVLEQNGEEHTERLAASFNALQRMENLPVDITVVAAGPRAQEVGTFEADGSGRQEVWENMSDYICAPRNNGNSEEVSFTLPCNRSSSDIAGGLRIADAIGAEHTMIFSGSVEGAREEFRSQGDDNQISVILAGRPGSTVSYLGSRQEAEFDVAGTEALVGEENTYTASSIDDIQETVQSIITDQYVSYTQEEFNGFRDVRNASGGALAIGVALSAALGVAGNRRRREEA